MIISSKGCAVQIEVVEINESVLFKDILNNDLLARFIPDFEVKKQGESQIKLRVKKSMKKYAKLEIPFSVLEGEYKEDFDSTDVIVMSEYILERLRQEENICTIHSSSVYKNNKGIVLLGNLTGSGKTSTAIALNKHHGFNIYSDDKTLVDIRSAFLVGQTSKIWPDLKMTNESTTKMNSLDIDKTDFDVKLAAVFIPIIGLSSEIKLIKYSPSQLKWLLYEETSKDIRLLNGLVFNLSYPLQSLDTQALAQKREMFAEESSKIMPCYYVQGSKDAVAKGISQIFDKISSSSLPD